MSFVLRKVAYAVGLGLSVLTLSSCATQGIVNSSSEHFNKVDSATDKGLSDQKIFRDNAASEAYKPHEMNMAYVNTRPISYLPQDPALMSQQVVLNQPYATPIDSVMSKLAQISGARVGYQFDLVDGGSVASGNVGGQAQVSGMNPSEADSTGLKSAPQVLDLSALMPKASDVPKALKVSISTQGTLKSVLDAVAGAIGASWKYDQSTNSITFFKYETKVFNISALPGNLKNKVALDTSTGATESATSSSLSYDNEGSIWKSIQDTLKTMVSSKGAFTVSSDTGMVVVRDVPDVINRVERYIKQVNQMNDQQVSVSVQVYRIDRKNQDSRGINWKAVLNTSRFAGSIDASSLMPQNAATNLASIVLGVPVGQSAYTPLEGSQALINSLSQLGTVSTLTSMDVQTINNQPAPVKVVTKTAYLKSIQNTSTANVGSSSTLTPGEVNSGFSMQIIPHIQPNGRDMLMQVMISLSTLNSISTFSSGGNSIQLPNVSTRDFVQTTWLHSGQSLVLAGFQNTETNDTKSGLVDAKAWPLGGSRQINDNKESIVVVITPVVTANRDDL